MPRLLTLSRAARLIGVSRGALQGKIRSGELATFEGMVSDEDLLRAYPEARLEDNSTLEKLESIKDAAFTRRMRERLLPSAEVLVARLAEMSRERARVESRLEHYRALVDELQAKLAGEGPAGGSSREFAAALRGWLRERLEPGAGGEEPLRVQENFLRVMSAHVQIESSGKEFFVDGNDTLLEAALRSGLALDYGCSIGTCGKCKARVISGEVHRTRHSDYALTEAEKTAGVVLMCCNTAVGDLVIEAREAHSPQEIPAQVIEASVKSVGAIGKGIRLLHLQTPRSDRLRFFAGQSVSLSVAGTPPSSYPVASCPCDDRNLHFHIRARDSDAFARRVFEGLRAGEIVRVEGPRGGFVLDESSRRPLLFVACDTGFAPVKSLIEHAMALDAAESLDLYWIASARDGRYLDNLCRAWTDALDNFRYVPIDAGAAGEEAMGAALLTILRDHPRLDAFDVYVAGPAALGRASERLVADYGLPRAQLRVNTLDS
ncbi:MAG TPA: 2Fe-2S iron-sulfur cluster-binding protein [Usitatibacter sp.]|nr:2Fe-2S iron-sulfur cluster-binding protein [Usitatibacter sp.]